jgi:phenylacetic acid degradation operon negative regulatory protein
MSKPSPKAKIKQNTLEWRVLKLLEEVGDLVLDAWLPRHYSYARFWRDILGFDRKPSEEERQRIARLVSNTLVRLRGKGLVRKIGSTRGAIWRLDGNSKALLQNAMDVAMPEDGKLRVFIFDIPEQRKDVREWVRASLVAAGFVMLQKSVWVGKRPLPETIFKGLADHNLFSAVHFFEVKDPGTLENIDWNRGD